MEPTLAGRRSRPTTTALAVALVVGLALLLGACAAGVNPDVGTPPPGATAPAGFWLGLWHGLIFPLAWIASLFMPDIAVYAVPNNGGWYDFGYFLGIVVFGVGAKRSHTVYRDRIVRVRD